MTTESPTPNPHALATREIHEGEAIVPRSFAEAEQFAKALATSSFIPPALRAKAPDVLFMVLAGRELGLAPLAAMRNFHVIEGTPRPSADCLTAIVLADSRCIYLKKIESTDDRATWETLRRGDDSPRRETFTKEDAIKAQLWSKGGNWSKYPKRMLSHRAKSFLCRDVYPEICAGLITAEEAEDMDATPTTSGFTAPTPQTAPAPAAQPKAKGKAPRVEPAKPANDDIIDAEIVDDTTAAGVKLGATNGAPVKDATAAAPPTPPAAASPQPPSSTSTPTTSATGSSEPSAASPSSPSTPASDDGFGEDDAPAEPDAAPTIAGFIAACLACTDRVELAKLKLKEGRWVQWSKTPEGTPFASDMRAAWKARDEELARQGGAA